MLKAPYRASIERHPSGLIRFRHGVKKTKHRDGGSTKHLIMPSQMTIWYRIALMSGLKKLGAFFLLGNCALFEKVEPEGRETVEVPLRGLTSYARQSIADGCGILQSTYDKSRQVCITLTCPGNCFSAIAAYARNHPYIVRTFKDWLVKRSQAAGIPPLLNYVVEIQGRKALHTHWCVLMPEGYDLDRFREDVRRESYRIYERISVAEGVDIFERDNGESYRYRWHEVEGCNSDVEPIRKSLVAYFAFYTSKEKHSEVTTMPREWLPTGHRFRWWGETMELKRLRKEGVEHLAADNLSSKEIEYQTEQIISYAEKNGINYRKVINPFSGKVCGVDVYGYVEDVNKTWENMGGTFFVKTYFNRLSVSNRRDCYLDKWRIIWQQLNHKKYLDSPQNPEDNNSIPGYLLLSQMRAVFNEKPSLVY